MHACLTAWSDDIITLCVEPSLLSCEGHSVHGASIQGIHDNSLVICWSLSSCIAYCVALKYILHKVWWPHRFLPLTSLGKGGRLIPTSFLPLVYSILRIFSGKLDLHSPLLEPQEKWSHVLSVLIGHLYADGRPDSFLITFDLDRLFSVAAPSNETNSIRRVVASGAAYWSMWQSRLHKIYLRAGERGGPSLNVAQPKPSAWEVEPEAPLCCKDCAPLLDWHLSWHGHHVCCSHAEHASWNGIPILLRAPFH